MCFHEGGNEFHYRDMSRDERGHEICERGNEFCERGHGICERAMPRGEPAHENHETGYKIHERAHEIREPARLPGYRDRDVSHAVSRWVPQPNRLAADNNDDDAVGSSEDITTV